MSKLIGQTLKRRSRKGHSTGPGPSILVYKEDYDGEYVPVTDGDTCEDICESLAVRLNLSSCMIHCFGLADFSTEHKKYVWFAPTDTISNSVANGESEIHFRMRFLPTHENVQKLQVLDEKCFKYLFCQVKWDFLHENNSYLVEKDREEEIRGVIVILILTMMRIHTAEHGVENENVKSFLKEFPVSDYFLPYHLKQKSVIDKRILKNSIVDRVKEYKKSYCDAEGAGHYLQFIKSFSEHNLKENRDYRLECYTCSEVEYREVKDSNVDTDSGAHIYFEPTQKQQLRLSVELQGKLSRLKIAPSDDPKNESVVPIETLSWIHIKPTKIDSLPWLEVQIDWTNGHPKNLYFRDGAECRSFVSCLEMYYRLMFDFYRALCPKVEATRMKQLTSIKSHGPVTNSYVKKKLEREKTRCHDYYALRSNTKEFGVFDLIYLPKQKGPLTVESLKKIEKTAGGYLVEGSNPETDLKQVLNRLVATKKVVPQSCMRINPQSEGCSVSDVIQSLLLEKRDLQFTSGSIEDEEQERRRLESQAKVYLPHCLENKLLIGQGCCTEVYRGLMSVNDSLVTIKQLRSDGNLHTHYKDLHEAMQNGFEKLMELNKPLYFVSYLGILMTSNIGMVMSGTSFGSLRYFLQYREAGLDQLTLHHLVKTSIHLTEALCYMEKQNCFHGNINCDNVVVEEFDHHRILVKLTDPGLVTLYNKLPLNHSINTHRLPWIAPERYDDLTFMTVKTEIWALGTTIWQMFSGGKSPLKADPKLKRKTNEEIKNFFMSDEVLSCPEYLCVLGTDATPIQKIKESFYKELSKCWTSDSTDRPAPDLLLKALCTCKNNHDYDSGGTYHDYDIIDYNAADNVAYPLGAEAGSKHHASSGIDSDGFSIDIPDLSCLDNGARGDMLHVNNVLDNKGMDKRTGQMGDHNNRQATIGLSVFANGLPPPSSPTPTLLPGKQPRLGPQPPPPFQGFIIPESRLFITSTKLGQGFYGEVYKAQLIMDNGFHYDVVAKLLRNDKKDVFQDDFKKEADVMKTLEHRNIVKFHGTCDSKQGYCLVMDLMKNKALSTYIKTLQHPVKNWEFLSLAMDIAAGMEYLESMKILHCDLAARNVLLTSDLCAKVSDFGLSKILMTDEDYYRRKSNKNVPIYGCAPEWTGSKRISSKSDVWSYGVVLWEMYSYGKEPKFGKDINDFVGQISKGVRWSQPEDCPDIMYRLMLDCWLKYPESRPSFQQCRERVDIEYQKEKPVPLVVTLPHNNVIIGKDEIQVDFQNNDMKLGDVFPELIELQKSNGCVGLQPGHYVSHDIVTEMLESISTSLTNHIKTDGAYGQVFKGKYKGDDVAVKRCTSRTEEDRFKREYELLFKLTEGNGHANIVKFIGLYILKDKDNKGENMYVMEYMANGTLGGHLKKCKQNNQTEPEIGKLKFLIDVAKGMDYLFSKAITHCDLTAVNVLLDKNFTAKISDFGWSKELQSDDEDCTYTRISACFKLEWTAPEALVKQQYTKYSDIWSYGVLCTEVYLDGEKPRLIPPCTECSQQFIRYQNGERYRRPPSCHIDVYKVITRCWQMAMKNRIRYTEIVEKFTSFMELLSTQSSA